MYHAGDASGMLCICRLCCVYVVGYGLCNMIPFERGSESPSFAIVRQ